MAASETGPPAGNARNRRSFLRSSGGYATGLAVAAGLTGAATRPAAADAADRDDAPEAIDHPATAAPSEPVMAYVHDAERDEVTIMAGTRQTTYRDPGLVKRLLAAANPERS